MEKVKSVKMAKEILSDIESTNKYSEAEKIEIYLQILDYNLLGYDIKKNLTDNQIKEFFNIFEKNKDVQINVSKNRMSLSLLNEMLNLMTPDKKIEYFNLLLDEDVNNDFTKTIMLNIKNNEGNKKIEISMNNYNKLINKYIKDNPDLNFFEIKYNTDDLLNLEKMIQKNDIKNYKNYYSEEIVNQLNLKEYENQINKIKYMSKKNKILNEVLITHYDFKNIQEVYGEKEIKNKIDDILEYNNQVIKFNDNELMITKDELLKIKDTSSKNLEDIYERFMFPIEHILRDMNHYLNVNNNKQEMREKEKKIHEFIKQEFSIEDIKSKYTLLIDQVINNVFDENIKINKNKI